jgi:hypothetical protein
MDTALAGVGLNKTTCMKNAFGATFCGADAKMYEEQFNPSVANAKAARTSFDEALPSVNAYYATMKTYEGMTAGALQEYAGGVSSTLIAKGVSTRYCLQENEGSETYSLTGPGGTVVAGACQGFDTTSWAHSSPEETKFIDNEGDTCWSGSEKLSSGMGWVCPGHSQYP